MWVLYSNECLIIFWLEWSIQRNEDAVFIAGFDIREELFSGYKEKFSGIWLFNSSNSIQNESRIPLKVCLEKFGNLLNCVLLVYEHIMAFLCRLYQRELLDRVVLWELLPVDSDYFPILLNPVLES